MTLSLSDKDWILKQLQNTCKCNCGNNLLNKNEPIKQNKLLNTAAKVGSYLKAIPKIVHNAVSQSLKKSFNFISTNYKKITSAIKNTLNKLKVFSVNLLHKIKTGFLNTVNKIKKLGSDILYMLSPKRLLSKLGNAIKNLIMNNPLVKGIRNTFRSIKKGISSVWNFGKNFVKGIFSGFTNLFGKKQYNIQTEQLAMNNLLGGTTYNYVLAKEAVFNGGENTLLLNGFVNDYEQRQEKKKLEKHNNLVTRTLLSINDFSSKIHKNIKEIKSFNLLKLAGILLAIGAIAATVSWISKTGLGQVIKNVLSGMHNIVRSLHFNQKGVEEANAKTVNLPYQIASNSVDAVSEIALLNRQTLANGENNPNAVNKDNVFNLRSIKFDYKAGDRWYDRNNPQKYTDAMLDKGLINRSVQKFLLNSERYNLGKEFDYGSVSNFSNDKGSSKLIFPVDVMIDYTEVLDEYGLGISLHKVKGLRHNLKVIGIKKLFCPEGVIIPANTLIALLGPNGQIIGDKKPFYENDTEFMNKINSSNEFGQADLNYLELRKDAKFNEALQNTYDKMSKDLNYQLELEKRADNPVKYYEDGINYLYGEYSGRNELSDNITTAINQVKEATSTPTPTKKSVPTIIAPQTNHLIEAGKGNVTGGLPIFANPNIDSTCLYSNSQQLKSF